MSLWHDLHPYAKTVTVAISVSTMVVFAGVSLAMLLDLTDGEVKDWLKLWKFVVILWALFAVAVGAAFYNLRVLSRDQWAALDKIRKGEIPVPADPAKP